MAATPNSMIRNDPREKPKDDITEAKSQIQIAGPAMSDHCCSPFTPTCIFISDLRDGFQAASQDIPSDPDKTPSERHACSNNRRPLRFWAARRDRVSELPSWLTRCASGRKKSLTRGHVFLRQRRTSHIITQVSHQRHVNIAEVLHANLPIAS